MANEDKKNSIKVTVAAAQAVRHCIQREFTQEPIEIEVTPEQLEELMADPKIILMKEPAKKATA
jgi:hypothetical protein